MNLLIHNFKSDYINIRLPEDFIKEIHNYNERFVNMQVLNIENCFMKKYTNFQQKVEVSKKWCEKYDVL